jgi:hypothetical protein
MRITQTLFTPSPERVSFDILIPMSYFQCDKLPTFSFVIFKYFKILYVFLEAISDAEQEKHMNASGPMI